MANSLRRLLPLSTVPLLFKGFVCVGGEGGARGRWCSRGRPVYRKGPKSSPRCLRFPFTPRHARSFLCFPATRESLTTFNIPLSPAPLTDSEVAIPVCRSLPTKRKGGGGGGGREETNQATERRSLPDRTLTVLTFLFDLGIPPPPPPRPSGGVHVCGVSHIVLAFAFLTFSCL